MSEDVLLTTCSAVQAELLKGALEAEGVPVRLEREALGRVYGLDVGVWATRVFVPAGKADRAQRLLDEVEEEA